VDDCEQVITPTAAVIWRRLSVTGFLDTLPSPPPPALTFSDSDCDFAAGVVILISEVVMRDADAGTRRDPGVNIAEGALLCGVNAATLPRRSGTR
jgi:hypothetical protein